MIIITFISEKSFHGSEGGEESKTVVTSVLFERLFKRKYFNGLPSDVSWIFPINRKICWYFRFFYKFGKRSIYMWISRICTLESTHFELLEYANLNEWDQQNSNFISILTFDYYNETFFVNIRKCDLTRNFPTC